MSNSLHLLVLHQVKSLFNPDIRSSSLKLDTFNYALDRVKVCLARLKSRPPNGFDHFNSNHYAMFLYYLSNAIWKRDGDAELATQLFYLNKAINGVELFYEIELPDYFLISHSVGLVFAQATYGNFCVFHQGCTVGRNNHDRPVLGDDVVMFPGSSVIGKCIIGKNTTLSPGVQLVNMDTPENSFVFLGKDGKPLLKNSHEIVSRRFFSDD